MTCRMQGIKLPGIPTLGWKPRRHTLGVGEKGAENASFHLLLNPRPLVSGCQSFRQNSHIRTCSVSRHSIADRLLVLMGVVSARLVTFRVHHQNMWFKACEGYARWRLYCRAGPHVPAGACRTRSPYGSPLSATSTPETAAPRE